MNNSIKCFVEVLMMCTKQIGLAFVAMMLVVSLTGCAHYPPRWIYHGFVSHETVYSVNSAKGEFQIIKIRRANSFASFELLSQYPGVFKYFRSSLWPAYRPTAISDEQPIAMVINNRVQVFQLPNLHDGDEIEVRIPQKYQYNGQHIEEGVFLDQIHVEKHRPAPLNQAVLLVDKVWQIKPDGSRQDLFLHVSR